MSKKKPLPPRVKRMTRQGRLNSARAWLSKYEGKNVLRSYCKHFAVNWRCAATELQMLGVKIDPNYLAQREKTEAEVIEQRSAKKQRAEEVKNQHWHPHSNSLSAYLAGDYEALYDLELGQMACDEEPL